MYVTWQMHTVLSVCLFSVTYLQTAWASWHGFQDTSNTTTRLAAIRLIPKQPAL